MAGIPSGPPSVTSHVITVCNEYGCTDDHIVVIVCPARPPNVQAHSAGCGAIALTWDSVNGADEYHIARAATGSTTFASVDTVSLPAFSDTLEAPDGSQWNYFVLAASESTPPSRPSDTVTVTLNAACDTIPPEPPVVLGPTLTGDPTPTWTWSSGGGGSGTFRHALGTSDTSQASAPDRATSYTPSSDLPEGAHTLYVWEIDASGNWSLPTRRTCVARCPNLFRKTVLQHSYRLGQRAGVRSIRPTAWRRWLNAFWHCERESHHKIVYR